MMERKKIILNGKEFIYCGSHNISRKAIVSDPCYELGTWCTKVIHCLPGTYRYYISMYDGKEWGERVGELIALLDGTKPELPDDCVAYVGVDTGVCGIFDYDGFARTNADKNTEEFEEWYQENVVDKAYDNFVNVSSGCFTQSGYGDGSYPVFILKNTSGEVVGIRIAFIDDEYEEEDDE